MYQGIPTIELRKTALKSTFLYEALENGEVVATRKSNRDYVAALIGENCSRIVSGVGRMDLLPGALRNYTPHRIALLKTV